MDTWIWVDTASGLPRNKSWSEYCSYLPDVNQADRAGKIKALLGYGTCHQLRSTYVTREKCNKTTRRHATMMIVTEHHLKGNSVELLDSGGIMDQ